eukprot:scaffold7067_cov245-Pinguiococcus_pyrenoidosus.AAC.9
MDREALLAPDHGVAGENRRTTQSFASAKDGKSRRAHGFGLSFEVLRLPSGTAYWLEYLPGYLAVQTA